MTIATPTPAPLPPQEPLATDCCGGGCNRCVFDIYADALEQYALELAAWQAEHGKGEASKR